MKKKNILIIGMGRFGRHLAEKFEELGDQVLIMDKHEEKIQPLLGIATYAQVGDCKDENVLRSIDVSAFDICFVCIGEDFQSSLEITSLLKDLGAKYVVSKAGRDIHAKFLARNGADDVIYPEKDMGARVAIKYSSSSLLDYFSISDETAIYELQVPKKWVDKTIQELHVRSRYGINILAVKSDSGVNANPGPNYLFSEGERVIVLGGEEDVKQFLE